MVASYPFLSVPGSNLYRKVEELYEGQDEMELVRAWEYRCRVKCISEDEGEDVDLRSIMPVSGEQRKEREGERAACSHAASSSFSPPPIASRIPPLRHTLSSPTISCNSKTACHAAGRFVMGKGKR